MKEQVIYTLNQYPKLKEHFLNFTCNPEHKLSEIQGLDVLPHEPGEYLSLEALGKEIEIRFSVVLADEFDVLGQVTAYLVKPDNNQTTKLPILSFWLDELGNIKYPVPTKSDMIHSDHKVALSKFAYRVLDKIINSEECQPLVNPES